MKKFLSSILALTLCVGAVGFPVNVAVADDGDPTPVQPTTAVDTFKMAEGASISITGAQGIRFRVEIGDDVVETAKAADDFGFLVFPQEYLATAVANVTAGTAENYHDKFDGELVENQVPADKAGTYGLFDYAEVSLSDEDLENAVYTDFDNGLQYVNVVMTDGVAENRDVELAAIAWYKTGDVYTYADFNADFSRSITYVAQQEYIAGNYSRDGLKKAFPWLTSKAFEINSGADMKELALASQTETFEGFTFKLARTIALGSDYVPVAESFAGKFDYNNKKIILVDVEAGKPFAAENEKLNQKSERNQLHQNWGEGYVNNSSKLIDATTARFWNSTTYTDNDSETLGTVAMADQVKVLTSEHYNKTYASYDKATVDTTLLPDYVDYNGPAISYSISTGVYLSVDTGEWTIPGKGSSLPVEETLKEDFEALKEIFTVIKFRFYIAPDRGVCSDYRYQGIFNYKGTQTDVNGTMKTQHYWHLGYWQEWQISIDDFVDLCSNRGDNAGLKGKEITDEENGNWYNSYRLLPLSKMVKNAVNSTLYIGDCVLA